MSMKKKSEKPIAFSGRRTWTMNPVTRIIPDKKKPKTDRKAKHKGRRDADPHSRPVGEFPAVRAISPGFRL